MLELLWVADAAEAQSEQTRPTRLWERWSSRTASPFGVILRAETQADPCPFPSWEYRPKTMPDLVLQVAANTGLEEPMWCFMAASRAPATVEHLARFRQVSGVRIYCPQLAKASVTGGVAVEPGPEHLLELQFDGQTKSRHHDFRPDLPLIFRW